MKIEEDCRACNGVGEVTDGKGNWKNCAQCSGTGVVNRTV